MTDTQTNKAESFDNIPETDTSAEDRFFGLKSSVGIDKESNRIIVKIDKKYFRPGEVDFLKGDYSKAKKILKWKPKYSIHTLIDDMINYEMSSANCD